MAVTRAALTCGSRWYVALGLLEVNWRDALTVSANLTQTWSADGTFILSVPVPVFLVPHHPSNLARVAFVKLLSPSHLAPSSSTMSTTTADDLPWPELGNVSRGATRGNQGQKGVLGPPDRDGRCVLQLRVQAGVLAVQLNRQASEWYRILDNEVNNALKTTKTYWRKARRRQDYDQQADQDHMELHEWLQQLKDKTMSHLELLMQKGDIQGPPYVMPDEIELTFLRKFIERHNAGIPHNPRLRNLPVGERPIYPHRGHSTDSFSPEPSDHGGFPEIQHQHSLGPSLPTFYLLRNWRMIPFQIASLRSRHISQARGVLNPRHFGQTRCWLQRPSPPVCSHVHDDHSICLPFLRADAPGGPGGPPAGTEGYPRRIHAIHVVLGRWEASSAGRSNGREAPRWNW